MNYLEAKKKAKEKYEMHLKQIELCKEVSDKIAAALPEGWNIDIGDVIFNLSIWKGSINDGEEADAGEFKYVCSIVQKAYPELNLHRFAHVSDDGKIIFLKAYDYLRDSEKSILLEIEIIAYNPKLMPNCKIEWKEEVVKRAVVSDECLGIGGGNE